MMLRRAFFIAAVASLLPLSAVIAGDRSTYVPLRERIPPAQLQATGVSDAQIDALDVLLREAESRGDDALGRDEKPDPMRYAGLDAAGFSTTAKGEVSGWSPGTVFELGNGQQWKVLKGSQTLRRPLQSPRVRLVPGVAGRWFLEVDEDLPKARVYRID